jgi:hypothetical protein
MKRQLETIVRDVNDEVSQSSDGQTPLAFSLAVLGVADNSVIAKVVSFLDELDEDGKAHRNGHALRCAVVVLRLFVAGFVELNEFENKHWREFITEEGEDDEDADAEAFAGFKPPMFEFIVPNPQDSPSATEGQQQVGAAAVPSAPFTFSAGGSSEGPTSTDAGGGAKSNMANMVAKGCKAIARGQRQRRHREMHTEFSAILEQRIEAVVKDPRFTMPLTASHSLRSF